MGRARWSPEDVMETDCMRDSCEKLVARCWGKKVARCNLIASGSQSRSATAIVAHCLPRPCCGSRSACIKTSAAGGKSPYPYSLPTGTILGGRGVGRGGGWEEKKQDGTSNGSEYVELAAGGQVDVEREPYGSRSCDIMEPEVPRWSQMILP